MRRQPAGDTLRLGPATPPLRLGPATPPLRLGPATTLPAGSKTPRRDEGSRRGDSDVRLPKRAACYALGSQHAEPRSQQSAASRQQGDDSRAADTAAAAGMQQSPASSQQTSPSAQHAWGAAQQSAPSSQHARPFAQQSVFDAVAQHARSGRQHASFRPQQSLAVCFATPTPASAMPTVATETVISFAIIVFSNANDFVKPRRRGPPARTHTVHNSQRKRSPCFVTGLTEPDAHQNVPWWTGGMGPDGWQRVGRGVGELPIEGEEPGCKAWSVVGPARGCGKGRLVAAAGQGSRAGRASVARAWSAWRIGPATTACRLQAATRGRSARRVATQPRGQGQQQGIYHRDQSGARRFHSRVFYVRAAGER